MAQSGRAGSHPIQESSVDPSPKDVIMDVTKSQHKEYKYLNLRRQSQQNVHIKKNRYSPLIHLLAVPPVLPASTSNNEILIIHMKI